MRFITLSVFATLLSAPAFAADLGTYRPGTPYSSTVAGGADVCDNQCAGDAQCRGWNYVKPNPRAAGVCEFLSSVSAPISSQISISGESLSAAPFSSKVTLGGTNTVRVGTQVTPPPNTVRVGQTATPSRKVVRKVQPKRIVAQQTSTRPIENLSLTEQQNRYRNGHAGVTQPVPQPQFSSARAQQRAQQQAYAPQPRQIFRPILDGSSPQIPGQQFQRPQIQPGQRPAQRRATGPRRTQGQGHPAPQFQDPRLQRQNFRGQDFQGQNVQGQNFQGQGFQAPQPQPQIQQQAAGRGQPHPPTGQPHPPTGQPIQAQQQPRRPRPSTPSQRLAQITAATRGETSDIPLTGPVALSPEQARKSLFGRLNDDLNSDLPTATAVPTQSVSEEPLGEVLAGGR